ncbi:MAG: FtsH protease activity modulator HflK [Methyloceanibacter sp.]
MPWSNQSGGGGWKGGPSGGPWGPRPGGPNQQPDLEEFLRRGQDRIRQALPGGRMGGPLGIALALVLMAVVGFFGFTVRVNPEELGVVLRFGEFVRLLPPGLNFRWPYPIEAVDLPKVTRVNRIEIGMRGSAENRETAAAVRDVPEESLMLTGDENIVDVDFVVFWRISDAPNFLFNIQDPEATVKDVAESSMREIVGQNDIEPILTEARAKTEAEVQQLMQKVLDSYAAGVQIIQVQLQKVDPPAQVIDAFRDVQAARADQERLQNEADAYANRIIPEAKGEAERILQAAQGYRDKVVAESQGEADRFIKIYEQYKLAPDVTRQRMYLETMERVLADSEKVIVDEKAGSGVVPYLPLSEFTKKRTPAPAPEGQQ